MIGLWFACFIDCFVGVVICYVVMVLGLVDRICVVFVIRPRVGVWWCLFWVCYYLRAVGVCFGFVLLFVVGGDDCCGFWFGFGMYWC